MLNISDDREAGFNIFMKPVDVKTANVKFQNSSLLAFNTPVILFVNSRSGSCFAKFLKIGILNEIILPSEPGLETTEIELQFNVLIGMNTFNDLYFCREVDLKTYLLGNIYRQVFSQQRLSGSGLPTCASTLLILGNGEQGMAFFTA